MKIESVCTPLNEFLRQNKIINALMPISVIGMLACAGVRVVDIFINLGSVVTVLAYFGFHLFALLVLSNCNFKMLAGGLAIYSISYIVSVLKSLFVFRSMPYSTLIYLLVYGCLAFLAFRKSGGTIEDLKAMAKNTISTAAAKVSETTKVENTVAKPEDTAEAAPADAPAQEAEQSEASELVNS